jgi:hypothetical protein
MVAMTALACSACGSNEDTYDQNGTGATVPPSSSTETAPTSPSTPGYQTSPQDMGTGSPATNPNGNYPNSR